MTIDEKISTSNRAIIHISYIEVKMQYHFINTLFT
jgi:hypothetical protein